jgi:LytR cell envelope-related transcriptional attenuator
VTTGAVSDDAPPPGDVDVHDTVRRGAARGVVPRAPSRDARGGHPRPTSRRGRAAARRRMVRAAAHGLEPPSGDAGNGPASPAAGRGTSAPVSRRTARPAGPPARQVRRRRKVVLAGMGALTVAGVGLAVAGLSTVRNSTVGSYEEALGPDEPGYQAHVVPTPTMGILYRAADGSLAGASLLALDPGDAGGTVIMVPPATVVPTTGETTIADVYRDEGAAAAASALGTAVAVAVTEHVEVDDAQWAQLVEPVGSVEVSLDEPLGEWPAGRVELEPGDVGRFLSAQAEGESDLDRLDRQQVFWNAWLPLVDAAGSDALPGEVGTGIGRFVRAIASGEGVAAVLPVTSSAGPDGERYRTDAERVGEFVSRTVAYPTAAQPGGRIRVRLLNGTTDPDLTPRAARALVAGGAEIVIAGNASSFDVTETRLVAAGDDRRARAELLAMNLGDAHVEAAPTGQDEQMATEDEIDVTVILGQDAGDLIER